MLVFDNVWQCIYYVFVSNSKWSSNFLYWASTCLSSLRLQRTSPALRDILSQPPTLPSFMSTFYHLVCCSLHLAVFTCISVLNIWCFLRNWMAWIWIVVKNTHKCFLINHMEGKLAKHSDFFPIIEFLHLKSLNSNSQQFHVLLFRSEILTVTHRWGRQVDILLLYCLIITRQYNTHSLLLLISYPAWLQVL